MDHPQNHPVFGDIPRRAHSGYLCLGGGSEKPYSPKLRIQQSGLGVEQRLAYWTNVPQDSMTRQVEDCTEWIDPKGTVHRLTLRLKEERCLHCKYSICLQDFTTREDRDPIIVHGVGYEEMDGSWEVLQYSNHLVVCMTAFETPERLEHDRAEPIGQTDCVGRIRLRSRSNSTSPPQKLGGGG